MLKRREAIPDESEFPLISPSLKDHSFPHHILTDEVLSDSLDQDRLAAIQETLIYNRPVNGVHITYIAPWNRVSLHESAGDLDMVFSQAVMEHVEQVNATYTALYEWVRPGGLMSHAIDYKSHGYTRDWNGHWSLSKFEWKIVKGNRPYLINRLPHSAHIESMKQAGFQIVSEIKKEGTPLARHKLAENFRSLSDDDLLTSGAFIQAIKRLEGRSGGI
jgi:hypothetical protein